MAGSEAVGDSEASGGSLAAGSLAEATASLLDHLAACHHAIGVDHYLRAERLLASLAVSGQMPQNTRDLESWLRPLICQSARDQERFAKDFEDWLRTRGEAAASFAPPKEPVEEVLREVKKGGRRWLIAGAIMALALAALVAIALWTAPATAPSAPRLPASPAAKQIGYPTFALTFPFVVFGVFLAWVLWRRSKARAFLVQCEAGAPASAATLSVAAAEPPIYNPRLLALAAKGFGIYRRLPSEALNVPASVEATARESGRFIPVPASRPAVPEYLVLIDRGSQADLFAQFAGGLVKRLEESNVAVDQFYFDRVPRQCYTRRGHQPVTIRELSERFPEHRVLVFSDGSGFLSPSGNSLAPWMEAFLAWETKILLTPNPRAYWGEREAFIAAAGWTVIPAEQEEIAALAHQVEPESSEDGFVPGLLGSLTTNERRWLRRSIPPREEIEALLTDLRVSLGAAGFHWLCACAAYPDVDWTVALYLGTNIRHTDGRPLLREPSFLAISRLPWFRYGVMPVWLRLALLSKLSREEQRGVRQALQMFLMSGSSGPLETYRLGIKQELRGPLNWLTRQFIRRRAPTSADDDPLRDEVFVKFLSGANPAAVPLPERIGNLFQSAPGQWLGFSRLTWQLVGLALLAEISQQKVLDPQSALPYGLFGLPMIIGGLLIDRLDRRILPSLYPLPAAERILAAGVLVLSLGCFVNALTGDFVTRGMAAIGIGLIFPPSAILIIKAESGDRRRTLAALALWSGTVSVPSLLPAFPVWLRLAMPLLTFLAWVLIPSPSRRPRWEILFAVPRAGFFFPTAVEDIYARTGPVALIAAALLAAANGVMPPWTMPVVLAAGCLFASAFLARRARAAHVYFAGLVFAAAPVFNAEFFGPLSLAGAVLLTILWRSRKLPPMGVRGLTLWFALLGFVLMFGRGSLWLAGAPLLGMAGTLLVAGGETLVDSVGTLMTTESAPAGFIGLSVGLWWAVREVGHFLGTEGPPKLGDAGTRLAVTAAALICALVLWRVDRKRRPAVPAALPAASDLTLGARICAAATYWLVGLLALPFYRRNRFVRFHAAQWLVLGILSSFVSFSITLLSSSLSDRLGAPELLALFRGVLFVISIFLTVQAARGKMTRLPLIGRWAERFAFRAAPPASAQPPVGQAPPASTASALKPTLFLSSTSDMRAEHEAVTEALLKSDIRLPQAVVNPHLAMTRRQAILNRLAKSTAFVAIIGNQSGDIDPDSGISIVQFEYEQARRLGLPCLIYIKRMSGESAIDQLADFRQRLEGETLVRYFETPEDLLDAVVGDVLAIFSAPASPEP